MYYERGLFVALEEEPDLYTWESKLTDYPGKGKSTKDFRPLGVTEILGQVWTSDDIELGTWVYLDFQGTGASDDMQLYLVSVELQEVYVWPIVTQSPPSLFSGLLKSGEPLFCSGAEG